jgi:hypothetical protein
LRDKRLLRGCRQGAGGLCGGAFFSKSGLDKRGVAGYKRKTNHNHKTGKGLLCMPLIFPMALSQPASQPASQP